MDIAVARVRRQRRGVRLAVPRRLLRGGHVDVTVAGVRRQRRSVRLGLQRLANVAVRRNAAVVRGDGVGHVDVGGVIAADNGRRLVFIIKGVVGVLTRADTRTAVGVTLRQLRGACRGALAGRGVLLAARRGRRLLPGNRFTAPGCRRAGGGICLALRRVRRLLARRGLIAFRRRRALGGRRRAARRRSDVALQLRHQRRGEHGVRDAALLDRGGHLMVADRERDLRAVLKLRLRDKRGEGDALGRAVRQRQHKALSRGVVRPVGRHLFQHGVDGEIRAVLAREGEYAGVGIERHALDVQVRDGLVRLERERGGHGRAGGLCVQNGLEAPQRGLHIAARHAADGSRADLARAAGAGERVDQAVEQLLDALADQAVEHRLVLRRRAGQLIRRGDHALLRNGGIGDLIA